MNTDGDLNLNKIVLKIVTALVTHTLIQHSKSMHVIEASDDEVDIKIYR